MIASLDVGMHALSSSIRRNIPAVPRSPMTLVAKSTIGSVSEARVSMAGRVQEETERLRNRVAWVGMAIPLFDTNEQLEPLRAELKERMATVIESGLFVLGPEVAAFEREFAEYLGVSEVVGVANGTDALRIALQALGVGEIAAAR